MDKANKIIVGISVGDINGIGIEIILKTFEDKRMLDFCTPVLFASNKLISYHKKTLRLNTSIHGITSLDKLVHGKVNLLNSWKEEVKVDLGKTTEEGGKFALKSLQAAVGALKKNQIDLIVTAPINKENIQSEEFKFPGHTEYLEENFDGRSLMILMTNELRIGLITGHIPVSKVSEAITPELIKSKVEIMYNSLKQDFNISKPKIAVLGLNPHCGDNGIIGTEDDEIIRPTITEIKETGKLVFGPYAADGFFGSKTYEQFDGVLAMYHDQGLAPFKALSFGNGVNFTAGLSKVRTSPDHGTGFDIAGKNNANPTSFKEALFTSLQIFKNRKEYQELTKNALKAK
ncbi:MULTISPECIES: 4-hydroxythreonine-4-phosphate dehydrogenase PdxA [Tenacibaculum]|uniref:4-hydroxythreonine-4-phosphate dehydrogenase PdxA n=1 Tax=Tenacibaculum TaxID=104267 RepID=UPI0012E60492|nr:MULTISPECIES: 4-hydroxythreonine-4-phosphate dehydrogenase PdxA [Tenacibaculum]GFD71467.1 4-hydroxythreonine-4-phosphate dehydrogenase [Tenacibaculum sp. KUL113]GFD81520.1 4-hydroxythreonine-4-phosphate dehydrogenase [Tenacibaculum sp. KUL118]KAF9659581.1 4-hydroxythreonine-4-phosphate dehydrogenase PdxA [Tenacibaculum mesophilum]MCG7500387.1 4-hydroxythreonine-4-phosphate dehydrogenase PdxA [Tenacibaculum sp. Mcav3-52]BFF38969.1 4-hydroxythreonine-4-phosphate dehydrogenase PdxA [Tenacibacu